jgi:cytochrome o ubiquinol oxidase subunit 1
LQIWFQIAAFGAFLIAIGIAAFVFCIYISFRRRAQLRDLTGDPCDGRTLEWSTSSPPPAYNFAFTPVVHDTDAWWDMKRRGFVRPTEGFIDIHMPKNTAAGVLLAALSTACGFALVWHVWWAAAATLLAIVAYAIYHSFDYQRDYYIPAAEVAATERARTAQLEAAHV